MATVPDVIMGWINSSFPKPRVDQAWLSECYNWVVQEHNLNLTNHLQQILDNIQEQILCSDLRDSMLHGTGLPVDISKSVKASLPKAPGILVEITAITEIGHSALSLRNTRQTKIDREGMDDEARRIAEEDEGPVPDYPRSMLKLELSDGATTVEAIEHRPIPELVLGQTPLGFKMVLKGPLIRRGIVFLEPSCILLKGKWTEQREVNQDWQFHRSLQLRLGQPDPGPPPSPAPSASGVDLTLTRPPLTAITEPPAPPLTHEHGDDEGQALRRRVPSTQASTTSTLVGSPLLSGGVRSIATNSRLSPLPPVPMHDSDFGNMDEDWESELAGEGSLATMPPLQLTGTTAVPTQTATFSNGRGTAFTNAENSSDIEFEDGDSMFADEDINAQLDAIERNALDPEQEDDSIEIEEEDIHIPNRTQHGITSAGSSFRAVSGDVIEIDEDGEGNEGMDDEGDENDNDKESAVVQTRRVRRRTNARPTTVISPPRLTQRSNPRTKIRALSSAATSKASSEDPLNIIDISD